MMRLKPLHSLQCFMGFSFLRHEKRQSASQTGATCKVNKIVDLEMACRSFAPNVYAGRSRCGWKANNKEPGETEVTT